MHSLGMPHSTDMKSIMFSVPTEQSYSKFKKVFENFDSEDLVISDRLDLVKMYLEPQDQNAWNGENSQMRKQWNDFVVKEHSECKGWAAKKVTTVASPLETRVGYGWSRWHTLCTQIGT